MNISFSRSVRCACRKFSIHGAVLLLFLALPLTVQAVDELGLFELDANFADDAATFDSCGWAPHDPCPVGWTDNVGVATFDLRDGLVDINEDGFVDSSDVGTVTVGGTNFLVKDGFIDRDGDNKVSTAETNNGDTCYYNGIAPSDGHVAGGCFDGLDVLFGYVDYNSDGVSPSVDRGNDAENLLNNDSDSFKFFFGQDDTLTAINTAPICDTGIADTAGRDCTMYTGGGSKDTLPISEYEYWTVISGRVDTDTPSDGIDTSDDKSPFGLYELIDGYVDVDLDGVVQEEEDDGEYLGYPVIDGLIVIGAGCATDDTGLLATGTNCDGTVPVWTGGWEWTEGNFQDKNDINVGFAGTWLNETTTPGTIHQNNDFILYYGLDVSPATGSAVASFWLLQDESVDIIPDQGQTNNTRQWVGQNTIADLLIQVSQADNDANAYVWNPTHAAGTGTADDAFPALDVNPFDGQTDTNPSGSPNLSPIYFGTTCVEGTGEQPICAVANTRQEPVPTSPAEWPYTHEFSNVTDYYDIYKAGNTIEGGVNVSAVYRELGVAVPCFSKAIVSTRTTNSVGGTLTDFLLAGFESCAIEIRKTGDTVVLVGDTTWFTIEIENTGLLPLNLTDITDDLVDSQAGAGATLAAAVAAGCNRVEPREICSFQVPYVTSDADTDPLLNTVCGTLGSTDGNDSFSDCDTHTVDLIYPGSIGDQMWLDEDGNGVFDAGEDGIANVDVNLYADFDGSGTVEADEKTVVVTGGVLDLDDSGTAGDIGDDGTWYGIRVVDGLLDTDGDGIITAADDGTVTVGGTTYFISAGYLTTDGTTKVTATLDGAWDQTQTDAEGGYLFTNLPPGTYDVSITAPTGMDVTYDLDQGWAGGTGTPNDTTQVLLAQGENNTAADFGLNWVPVTSTDNNTGTGAIGDRIWADDGDGVQQEGEAGIEGVTVSLYEDDDGSGNFDGVYSTLVTTTTTDATGNYIFDDLAAGAYVVQVDESSLTAAGVTDTTPTGDPDGDADNTSEPILLAPGDVYVNADWGYSAGTTVSGTIYQDGDYSGSNTAGDADLYGITVNLVDGSGNIVATSTTDANGLYTFSGVLDGTYTVEVGDTGGVLSDSKQSGDPSAGQTGAICTDCDGIGEVTVSGGVSVTGIDFGYVPDGQDAGEGLISGSVGLDVIDNDLVDTGEELAGIDVTLYQLYDIVDGKFDVDGDGLVLGAGPFGDSDDSDAIFVDQNGDGLNDAVYCVFEGRIDVDCDGTIVNAITGLLDIDGDGAITVADDGTYDGHQVLDGYIDLNDDGLITDADDGSINGVSIIDGWFNYDGLFTDTVGIRDFSPLDLNDTFVLTNGDNLTLTETAGTFLQGYTVEDGLIYSGVSPANGDQLELARSTTETDASGFYAFGNLDPTGIYRVELDSNTFPAGTTNDFDYGGAPVDGVSSDIYLGSSGGVQTGVDFGLIGAGFHSIEGTIWNDVNADGTLATGETVLFDGVTVELRAVYEVIGGLIDTDGDNNTNDNGFIDGIAIIGGYLDINGDGVIDDDDDGSLQGYTVIDGWVNVDGSAFTDTADVRDFSPNDPNDAASLDGGLIARTETVAGDYSFEGLAEGKYTVKVTDENRVLTGYWLSEGADCDNTDGNPATDCPDNNSQTDPYTVTLSGGTETTPVTDSTADFGYYIVPAIVGNTVFQDENGNGVLDGGEGGYAGVDVVLTITYPNGAGTVTVVTTTDANGNYSFGNLLLDEDFNGDGSGQPTYELSLDASQAALIGYQTTEGQAGATDDGSESGTGNGVDDDADSAAGTAAFPIQGGSDDTNDFGFALPSALIGSASGLVWLDTDLDGVWDVGEPGIDGVTVDLYEDTNGDGSYDTFIGTAVTDANGYYSFPDLPPGDYQVQVDSDELLTGGDLEGLDETAGNIGGNASFNLTAGETEVVMSLGYVPEINTAVIEGNVWSDAINQGVLDASEIGIGEITVDLYEDLDGDGIYDDFVATTTTGPDGSYLLTGVEPGDYVVKVDTSDTDLVTFCAAAGVPDCDTTPTASDPITVEANDVITGINFGFDNPDTYTVTDTVWSDLNGDGVHDAGESGIAGVTVDLYECVGACGGDDDLLVGTVTTDQNGDFTFDGLPEGTYEIVVSDNDGVLNDYYETTGTGGFAEVDLDPNDGDGIDDTNADGIVDTIGDDGTSTFGYRTPGTIAGNVYSDADEDGSRTDDESGFPAVVVELYEDTNGDGSYDTLVASTTTAADGSYSFDFLNPGDYEIVIPSAPTATQTGDPDDTLDDSTKVVLNAGESIGGLDFGYYDSNLSDISGTVFNDLNENAVHEEDGGDGDPNTPADNEDGIAGVTISLSPEYAIIDGKIDLNGDGNTVTNDNGFISGTLDDVTVVNGRLDLNGDGVVDSSDNGTFNGIDVVAGYLDVDGDGTVAESDDGGTLIADPVATTVTDADGNYEFVDVPDGNYVVSVTDDDQVVDGYALTSGLDERSVTATAGTDVTDIDFGYVIKSGTASIGDTVWLDTDGDGERAANEAGLSGVSLLLYADRNQDGVVDQTVNVISNELDLDSDGVIDAADSGLFYGFTVYSGLLDMNGDGTVDASDDGAITVDGVEYTITAGAIQIGDGPLDGAVERTTTGTDGEYLFSGLPAGFYQVGVEQGVADNLVATVGTSDLTGTISLSDGETYLDADFGYVPDSGYAVLGDSVWYDVDADGLQDPGEVGIGGVTVQILDENGAVIAETTTNPDGSWLIVLPEDGTPTTYAAIVDTSTLPGGLVTTPTNLGGGDTYTFEVQEGDVLVNLDFGYQGGEGARIGDEVFLDLNNNNLWDAGEGISGVKMTVSSIGIFDGYIDINGDGVVNGDDNGTYGGYTVTAGVLEAAAIGTVNDPTVLNGYTVVSDGAGGAGLDINNNGTVDANDDLPEQVIAFTKTDADGRYVFDNLLPGDYRVDVGVESTLPGGLTQTFGEPRTSVITVAEGATYLAADFGYQPDSGTATIGDTIWRDVDGNTDGVQDGGEVGIGGVTVYLCLQTAPSCDAANAVSTTRTASDGSYLFTGVAPGDYTVAVDAATVSGTNTGDPDGGADGEYDLTVVAGQMVDDADFAYKDALNGNGSIGDTIYNDNGAGGGTAGDGVQNGTELGIEGVTVNLTTAGRDGVLGTSDDLVVATTTTDGSGNYSFDGLPVGDYTVTVTDIDGVLSGLTNTQTVTAPLTISCPSGCNSIDTADFGYYEAVTGSASIGDTVYFDTDGGGTQNGAEIGISGVTLDLYDLGADGVLGGGDDTFLGTTTTGEDGSYLFEGLIDGDYQVVVTDANNLLADLTPTEVAGVKTVSCSGDTCTSFDDADFGYQSTNGDTGALGGTLWHDTDQTSDIGVLDLDESGLEGITVQLWLDNNNDGVIEPGVDNLIRTSTTDANGDYLFLGLPPGNYIINVVDEKEVIDGYLDLNADGVVDQDDDGMYGGYAVIDGALDIDGSGIIDSSDNGSVYGVAVIGGGLNIDDANGIVDSNDDGRVGDNVLGGFEPISDNSPDPNADNNSHLSPYPTTLTLGEVDTSIDFAYEAADPSSISGTVFEDSGDSKGTWDDPSSSGDDAAVAGASVALYVLVDGIEYLVGTTVTDAQGSYSFVDLPVGGTYVVKVDVSGTDAESWEQTVDPDTTGVECTVCDSETTVVNLSSTPVTDLNFGYWNGDVVTTPVTLAYFEATAGDEEGVVQFSWATATETGNVGFDLYAVDGRGAWTRINSAVIPAAEGGPVDRRDYSYFASGIEGTTFYIVDLDIFANDTPHGPFELNQSYGLKNAQPNLIDRKAINDERKAKKEARKERKKEMMKDKLKKQKDKLKDQGRWSSSTQQVEPHWAARVAGGMLSLLVGTAHAAELPVLDTGLLQIEVTQSGVQRVSYQDLAGAGLGDLNGANPKLIALTNRGELVSLTVDRDPTGDRKKFGPGWYLEFVAEPLDSLYTKTNVYVLYLDEALAGRVSVDGARLPKNGTAAEYYLETIEVAEQRLWESNSPTDDPWIMERVWAFGSLIKNYPISVDDYAGPLAPVTLETRVWGFTDFPDVDNDHHLLVDFNDDNVADVYFDGVTEKVVSAEVQVGKLQEGLNKVTLRLPMDNPDTYWDLQSLDGYQVTYPRRFISRDGNGLSFSGSGEIFTVEGLSGPDLVVYRTNSDGSVSFKDKVDVVEQEDGSYHASFAGTDQQASYHVATLNGMAIPALEPPVADTDITSMAASYLVIAHPDFIGSNGAPVGDPLQDLKLEREADGYSVLIADLEQVYAQFGFGIVDPQAIRDYIAYARLNMGTQMVLLVGGDTLDYHGYLDYDVDANGDPLYDAVSFVPSLYAQTGRMVFHAPVDPLYTDTDGDMLPDLAIGRFPVRTSMELRQAIDKTLAWRYRDYGRKSLFVADKEDTGNNYNFSADSDDMITRLPAEWQAELTQAYSDDLGAGGARSATIAAINSGVALTSYVGHSGPSYWSFDFILQGSDAASLTNNLRPTILTQWGCWNTFYVSEKEDTMGHEFLLSGDQGAAAVLGASTLTDATHERRLAKDLYDRLFQQGMPLGEAIRLAKEHYALTSPEHYDVLLGWTLLGDPALVMEP